MRIVSGAAMIVLGARPNSESRGQSANCEGCFIRGSKVVKYFAYRLDVPFILPGNEPGSSVRSHPAKTSEGKMPSKLYVGNLAYSVSSDDLHALFSQVGQVQSATVITDKFSGQSKGFGFVEMTTAEEVANAIRQLND